MELAIAVLVVISALGGVYLGHWFTLRSIAHVQPSTADTVKMNMELMEEEDNPYEPNDGDYEPKSKPNVPESVNDFFNNIKKKYGKDPNDMYGLPGSS